MVNGEPGWDGYYLSAYGLAVKHGYTGTEEEWLDYLKGADIEMRYLDEKFQWKNDEETEWHTLEEFSLFQEDILRKAANAQTAADRANTAAEGAETAKARADISSGKANTAADSANTAAGQAESAARNAAAAKKAADAATANADNKAQKANGAAQAADTAAQEAQAATAEAAAATASAQTAAQNARESAQAADTAAAAADASKAAADTATANANAATAAANTATEEANAARDAANTAAQAAEEQAQAARESALSADSAATAANTAADSANTAGESAASAAQVAQEKAQAAQTAATAANTAATSATNASSAANAAAASAASAAQAAQTQADYAKAQGDRANDLVGKIEDTDIGGMAADILALQNGKADLAEGKVPESQLPEFSRLRLGETEAAAYRGDRGKLAYEHAINSEPHITAAERTAWNAKAGKAEMEAALALKADLVNGQVPVAQLPEMNYDPSGSAAAVQTTLNSHIGNKSNPHGVTAGQIGLFLVVGTSTAGWTKADCDYLCDGVDDQVEIQAAIDALPECYGEVRLLSGTYNITDWIMIKSKYHFTFSGVGSTPQLNKIFTTEGRSVVRVEKSSFVLITGFRIDGNRSDFDTNNNYLISVLSDNSDIEIARNYFQNSNSIRTLYSSCVGALIHDNSFTNCSFAISDSGVYSKIFNNTLNIGENGIYSGMSSLSGGTSIYNNQILNMSNTAISVSSNNPKENFIYSNMIQNCETGISISQDYKVVACNTIRDCRFAIRLYSNYSIAIGNMCYHSAPSTDTYTILCDGSNNLISSNIIYGKDYTNSGTGNTFVNNKYN